MSTEALWRRADVVRRVFGRHVVRMRLEGGQWVCPCCGSFTVGATVEPETPRFCAWCRKFGHGERPEAWREGGAI